MICHLRVLFNTSFTDWVQNVPRCGIFLNSSRWYRVTMLPVSVCLFIEVPLSHNNHHSAHILLLTYGMFF